MKFNVSYGHVNFSLNVGHYQLSIADDINFGNVPCGGEGKFTVMINIRESGFEDVDMSLQVYEELYTDDKSVRYGEGVLYGVEDIHIEQIIAWLRDESTPKFQKKENYKHPITKIMLVRMIQAEIFKLIKNYVSDPLDSDLMVFATNMQNAIEEFHDRDQYV